MTAVSGLMFLFLLWCLFCFGHHYIHADQKPGTLSWGLMYKYDLWFFEMSMLQSLLEAFISGIAFKLSGKSLQIFSFDGKMLMMVTLSHLAGTICSNAAIFIHSVSIQNIFSCFEPIMVYILVFFLDNQMKNTKAILFSLTLLSLSPFLHAIRRMRCDNLSFTNSSIILGIIPLITRPLRNIYFKALSDGKEQFVQKCFLVSFISFLITLPLVLVKLAYTWTFPSLKLEMVLKETSFHLFNNSISLFFLEKFSPLFQSFLGSLIRYFVVIITFNPSDRCFLFSIITIPLFLVGVSIFFMKWEGNSKANEIRKHVVKYSVLLNVVFGFYTVWNGTWKVNIDATKLYPQSYFSGLLPANNFRHLDQRNGKLTFHAIFTTSPQNFIKVMDERGGKSKVPGEFNWRHWRCVESVFYHHPNATMIIYSNTLHLSMLDVLRKKGYDAYVQRYKLSDLAQGTSAVEFIRDELPYAMEGQNWYSHETDLIRLLLLYKYGGIYIDTDVIIVKDWHDLPSNVIGWESSDTLNGAILKFDKPYHPFLQMCIEQFSRHYSQAWAENGPLLLSRVYQQWSAANRSNDVILVNSNVFYMFFYGTIAKECFEVTFGAIYNAKMKILEDDAYAVHLYSKMTGDYGIKGGEIIKNGTICEYLLSRFCVLCHES
ncbi:uncharacterized protein LOC124451593 isoform X2 [Xenia sp. Carnegie-2017]|nr:uncharacterized protein LOC124451593 isoform X2 [Xenia sp. Carnegie-2017]